MDPRVRDHAEVLVDHSTEVEPGEDVLIRSPPAAAPLVVALHEAIGERGARPLTSWTDERAHRAFLRASEPEALEASEHVVALLEASDVLIQVLAARNCHEKRDVPAETQSAFARAMEPLWELQEATRTVLTRYPTPAAAQRAGMSTAAYEDLVWSAICRDWQAQRAFQAQLVERLDDADEVRVVAGDGTDLVLSVAGNRARSDAGEENLPGGEVYTAPRPHSAHGTFRTDVPLFARDCEIEGVELTFEDGEVVDYAAESNEAALADVLETDEGARRLGEVGIGTNRAIDRYTRDTLFDEKAGDTVHVALGHAYASTVGEGNAGNESVVHEDLIADVSEDARVEFDGEVVQRDGTFVFEDGFEE